MNSENLSDLLNFAVETAYLAGRSTLGYFQTGIIPDIKKDDTPVTIADRNSEELIRGQIEKNYPLHAILGEEFGIKGDKDASHRWIIDPIDGTKSFVHGVPLYAVLIGLEIEGKTELGVAYFPALDEMIAAASGLGCWWNGRRAHVSSTRNLSRSVVVSTDVKNYRKFKKLSAWERILNACYIQAGWGDAYGYLLVATGRADIMLDPILAVWDAAPFPPILSEAGGYFGDWHGNPTIYGEEGLATSNLLLTQTLSILQG
jgi:myo-inositol-1(or 4)-monophosphatase